jgi:hypothetical protein
MFDYIDKQVVNEQIDNIIFGIRIKDINTIVSEIYNLKQIINDYKQPYQCSTCKIYPCSNYKDGLRNCNRWK